MKRGRASAYQPPYTLTGDIVSLVASIAEQVGRLSALPGQGMDVRLRRVNRIRNIAGSLAIEGNTLTEQQIATLLDGKAVLAPPRDILEAGNANAAYARLPEWDAFSETDLLEAHRLLMQGLLEAPGTYRGGGVGVMAGDTVIHMAPPASRVPTLMTQLFDWLREGNEHPLIASSVFHYEFEFIHPFADGNGRLGRLWQTAILAHWHPVLAWLPVESLVHREQSAYYAALNASTAATDCAPFIHFMLSRIHEALRPAATGKTIGKTTGEAIGKTPAAVFALLAKNPRLTVPELARRLGKSELTIHRAIRKLREAGRLERVGPDKGGHWKVEG